VALALLALAGAAGAMRYWRRQDGALIAFSGATLALTLVLLMGAHRWLHTPFPQEGAIYLIPLSVLTVTAAILKGHNKAAQLTLLLVCTALLVRYVSQFPIAMYTGGREFAGGRSLAKSLRESAGTGPVRIGASLAAEPIITYYRTRYRQSNWQFIEQPSPTGVYNYYVLTPDDAGLIEQRHLHVMYRDAGLTLAQ
jgi:hypothetical protein